MKRIINRKKYSTEEATHIEGYYYYTPRDFRYIEEDLYQKGNGDFFLAGKGGPLSKYAESDGDTTGSGSDIIPLCEDEAKDWMEEHANHLYENYFEVEE